MIWSLKIIGNFIHKKDVPVDSCLKVCFKELHKRAINVGNEIFDWLRFYNKIIYDFDCIETFCYYIQENEIRLIGQWACYKVCSVSWNSFLRDFTRFFLWIRDVERKFKGRPQSAKIYNEDKIGLSVDWEATKIKYPATFRKHRHQMSPARYSRQTQHEALTV